MSLAKSGLQKEVLHLYRRALRIVKTKPEHVRSKFRLYIQYTFHANARKVPPRNVSMVEHLLRQGRKQIEQLEEPGVKDCWVSQEMSEWSIHRHTPK